MQALKGIFNFYINSSIHVALATYSLSWLTLLQFGLSYDENILYMVFFATITGYNFVKYFGLAKLYHRRLTKRLKIIQLFSLVCFIVLCFYLFQLKPISLLYLGVFGAMTFLYAIPVIPKRFFLDEQHNLRSISGLKVYVIAVVWSGVTVVLPLVNNTYPMAEDVWVTAIQRFLFVVVLMLPFEIRDLNHDSLKLATIPQRIGVKRTKIIGSFLLLLCFLMEFLKPKVMRTEVWIMLVVTLVTLILLLFASKRQSRYYSSFFVEAIPILWLVLMLIA